METNRVVICTTHGCEQVLATVGERGDLYPVIMGAYVDSMGRTVISCPACGKKNRLPTRRRAA